MRTTLGIMDLELKDVIDLDFPEGYDTATVIRIETKNGFRVVTLFRPYITTSDPATYGRVIPYIGFEQFDLVGDKNSTRTYNVVRRG